MGRAQREGARGPMQDAEAPIGAGLSSEVFAEGPDRVLKLYRAPFEPAAIENEFVASQLAYARGFPVARPFARVERDGRPGILFERIHGTPLLRHHARNPLGLLAALRDLARLQAALHASGPVDLPPLRERLRADIGWARAPEPIRAAALAALDALPEGHSLLHGDIHPGNVLVTQAGLAILDWQKASTGHPAADVCRTDLMLRHGRIATTSPLTRAALQATRHAAAAWYLRHARAASGLTRAQIDAWRLPLMVARLCARRTDQDGLILAVVEGLGRTRN